MDTTTIVALIVALGGWALAGVTAWLNYRTKVDETFFHALDWLSGGSQKRNLGIAVVESTWQRRRFRRISTPLLCNSAVYLLLRTESRDSPNELNNLRRIMHLLTAPKKIPREHQFHYETLLTALDERPGAQQNDRGLTIIPATELASWKEALATFLPQRPQLDQRDHERRSEID
ncbi:hypothetical protein [Nocardia sp. NPDC024068]|uniref:hypothetical protein n=1 Tax=Nocardia sp. NPDC024068 TaxID=3157197 RepID=UPI0034081293